MPRVPGLDPAEGGGAAERLHEFEQSRGIEGDEPRPEDEPAPDACVPTLPEDDDA